MKDLRSVLSESESLSLMTTEEDGFLLYPLSTKNRGLGASSAFLVSSEMLLNCNCPFSYCKDKQKIIKSTLSSSPDKFFFHSRYYLLQYSSFSSSHPDSSIHGFSLYKVSYQGFNNCYVNYLQASDLSTVCFIFDYGFFSSTLVGSYLKCTPRFARCLKASFADSNDTFYYFIEDSSDKINNYVFGSHLISSELLAKIGDPLTPSESSFSDLKLLVNVDNPDVKKLFSSDLYVSNSIVSSSTINDFDWDPVLSIFLNSISDDDSGSLFTTSNLVSYCVFVTVFALVLFFWKLIHTIFVKFLKFVGLVK